MLPHLLLRGLHQTLLHALVHRYHYLLLVIQFIDKLKLLLLLVLLL
jgi:hypothetical protein